jgi:retron-type reverse transcriptase
MNKIRITKRNRFRFKRPKLEASLPFVKKDAMRNMNVSYYKAFSRDMKDYLHRENEKRRRSTKRWDFVTEILSKYKSKGLYGQSGAGIALNGIYKNNCAMVRNEVAFKKTTNLIKVVSRPEMLWLAYKRLKGNRGILTKASAVSKETFNNYTETQKVIFYKKKVTPDGFSFRDIHTVSSLIRKNSYPWGSSRRIWLDKPGSKKKRPITIPPFMDRLVQEAIKMVLVAIWEPDFEKMNRSFGFRPNKSCHDAMAALQSKLSHTYTLNKALEGDVSGAYDNIRKEDVISCLEEKIQDRKFINFMRDRLDYDYVDNSDGSRVRPAMGIPQGGIDSPYLFNIVFHQLDKFIMGDMQNYLENLNLKVGLPPTKRRPRFKYRRNLNEKRLRMEARSKKLRQEGFIKNKDTILTLEKETKQMRHVIVRTPYFDERVRRFRLFYVRYADDWILLTNADVTVVAKMKQLIKDFLFKKLGAQLSDEKTLITDTRKDPAHFLGFEIVSQKNSKYMKVNGSLRRISVFPLVFRPDRKRLINRLHSRGFCDKRGSPISVPWLTGLEATVIIERFNATIRGTMNYYCEWVSRPSTVYRWIYILRYSCLKTLAHKYKSTISKIFKRFGTDRYSTATKTVEAFATIKLGDISYEKGYKLATYKSTVDKCLDGERWKLLNEIFIERENGTIGGYPIKLDKPTVTHKNFLDGINWVSMRSRASFDMPCALCGVSGQTEMHHIRHIIKTAYRDLTEENYLKMLALRNRKQIPVCHTCHIHVIHKGNYQGPPLKSLINITDKLVDNRVIHLESYVKPGQEYFSKPLEQRGWKRTD